MANAKLAHGTQFSVGGTTVGELTQINGCSLSADTVEVTSHDSTEKYREFVQGLRDGGEISIEGAFLTASGTTIVNAFNTTSTLTARIVMPTSPSVSIWSASIVCTGFEMEAPMDDKIGYSATFKVSGKPLLYQA